MRKTRGAAEVAAADRANADRHAAEDREHDAALLARITEATTAADLAEIGNEIYLIPSMVRRGTLIGPLTERREAVMLAGGS